MSPLPEAATFWLVAQPVAQPALVVLREQRQALRVLNLRARHRRRSVSLGSGISPADRVRLVDLAVRVLADAGAAAEAACHRLLVTAEGHAAEIVRQAHGEAGPQTWTPSVTPVEPPVAPRPAAWPGPGPWAGASEDDEMAAAFFATVASDGTDPWAFMDKDDLVGAGPAFVRRLLGRR